MNYCFLGSADLNLFFSVGLQILNFDSVSRSFFLIPLSNYLLIFSSGYTLLYNGFLLISVLEFLYLDVLNFKSLFLY